MSVEPSQNGPTTPEVLARLVRALPPTFAELKVWRAQVQEAMTGFEPLRDPLAAAVRDCVTTLRTRASEVHKAAAPAAPLEAPPPLEFHARDTMAVPADEVASRPAAEPAAAPAPSGKAGAEGVHWTQAERGLYEDIIALFDLGDHTGAMTSFERLVMLAPDAEELATFLDKNGDIFLRLYHDQLGSLDRVAVPQKEAKPVKIPAARASLILDILRLCDGHRPLKDVLKRSKYGEIRTLVTLAHLARSGFIEVV